MKFNHAVGMDKNALRFDDFVLRTMGGPAQRAGWRSHKKPQDRQSIPRYNFKLFMSQRPVHSEGTYAHYVTFSCYKRRKLLNADRCKRIVLGVLLSELRSFNATCVGFVLMPDHVHAILWFSKEHQVSAFMNKWKERTSKQIGIVLKRDFASYIKKIDNPETVWQSRYYDFNIHSDAKIREKLDYMHNNPVRAGLVKDILDWSWSSARGWYLGESVGVPLGWPS